MEQIGNLNQQQELIIITDDDDKHGSNYTDYDDNASLKGEEVVNIDYQSDVSNKIQLDINNSNNNTHATTGTTATISKAEFTITSISKLTAAFFSNFVIIGTIYSFGIYQSYYTSISLGSPATISVIGSIGVACLSFFAIVSGRLSEVLGPRPMTFTGGCLMTTGLLLASISTTQLYALILTQGLILGLGASIAYFPILAVISAVFGAHRGVAVGIAVSGAGVGGLVISITSEMLIRSVGVEWCLRITGLVCFAIISVSSIFMTIPAPTTSHPRPSAKFPTHVLNDPVFWLTYTMTALSSFGFLVPILFASVFATSIGLTPFEGALSIAVYNIGSTLGRITIGLLSDSRLGALNSMILCVFASGASILLIWPLATTFSVLCVLMGVNGFAGGGIISLPSTVMAEVYGVERGIGSVVGCFFTSFSGGFAGGAPIAGILLGMGAGTGGGSGRGMWVPVILFSGGIQVFGCLFGVLARVMLGRRRRRSIGPALY